MHQSLPKPKAGAACSGVLGEVLYQLANVCHVIDTKPPTLNL
jgi:hypothetical protein